MKFLTKLLIGKQPMKSLTKILISVSALSILAGCANNENKMMDHSSHKKAGHAAMNHDDHGMEMKHDDYSMEMKHDDHSMEMKHDDHGGHDLGHAKSAVGKPAPRMTPTKIYQVSMLDSMQFVFNQEPELSTGDVVEFIVTNDGKIPHEFSIGNAAEQSRHNAMMKSMPNMDHGHSDSALTVQPGQTATLLWQFTGNEQVVFACNIPGHFEAGMKYSTQLN